MITLARIVCQHKHAVERDLYTFPGELSLAVLGTPKLPVWKLLSIVMASPPGTAVYHAETANGTLTQEAQLLANLGEQHAGLLDLKSRYPREGVDSEFRPPRLGSFEALPSYKGLKMEAYPVSEFTTRLAQRQAAVREARARAAAEHDAAVMADE